MEVGVDISLTGRATYLIRVSVLATRGLIIEVDIACRVIY